MGEKVQYNTSEMKPFGDGFAKASKMDSPDEAIETLMDFIGTTFTADRVYVFEKNSGGSYDCTYEWCGAHTFSKKHLMQNVEARGVRFYYNYYLRGRRLVIRDMNAFKQEDYHLYKILEPQNLNSLISGQITYDNQDIGFIGVDNPGSEQFSELENLFEAISYFVTLQIQKKRLREHIEKSARQPVSMLQHKKSLYKRIVGIRMEEAAAIVYCKVFSRFMDDQSNDRMTEKVIGHAENVLSSIFGSENVFHLVRNEFLVFFEDNEDMDISSINHYMALTKRTLESLNILTAIGASVTTRYEDNFFELVQQANMRMMRQEQKYREASVGKYHMEEGVKTYSDMIEIRPDENVCHVLYSEYQMPGTTEESLDIMLKSMTKKVVEEEQMAFRAFWDTLLEQKTAADDEKTSYTYSFSVLADGQSVSQITVSVMPYTDVSGDRVLLCCTR